MLRRMIKSPEDSHLQVSALAGRTDTAGAPREERARGGGRHRQRTYFALSAPKLSGWTGVAPNAVTSKRKSL